MSDLFLICVKQKYGYMVQKGRIIIDPIFTLASDFSDGCASVGQPDPKGRKDRVTGMIEILWGFIDAKGNPITPIHFQNVRTFSEGFAQGQRVSIAFDFQDFL